MDLNQYRLNAYKKAQGAEDKSTLPEADTNNQKAPVSISKEIRHNSQPGHEPLVHKAVFEKINTKLDQMYADKKASEEADRKAREEAEIAARTGTWYGKKNKTTEEDVKAAADVLKSGGLIKVGDDRKTEKDSIYRRVAKFLVIIGVDEAAKIIPHLTEEQTEKIIPEIATIRGVTPEESEEILKEFNVLFDRAREEGGVDTARTILTKAYGAERAEEVLSKSTGNLSSRPFDFLDDADSDRIQLLLSGESAQTKALVLSQLDPKKAAGVINKMNDTDKRDVMLRLAKLKAVSPEVMQEIGKSLHQKLLTQNTENSENMDGRGVLAQILKRMDPGAENGIIDTLSEENPELGADLRKRLFTEEDVVNCDDRYLQEKLRTMANEDIALLIKGKDSDFRGKIFRNVSKTRGDTILEEESLLTHVLKSDSERMTSRFYAELRRAWENGELRINGRDDDEVYV